MIATYVTIGTSSILVNGQLGKHIWCCTGLRQCNPLFSYLFILMAKVYSKICEKIALVEILQQVGTIPHLCCLKYTDDTLRLAPTDTPFFTNIKIILVVFEIISRFKFNYSKSYIFKLEMTLDTQTHNACPSYIVKSAPSPSPTQDYPKNHQTEQERVPSTH